ncbi:hypothetical protein B0H10DRAFT_1950478 [Mycena sp. CBHHK59/15]|nr:hypothetical protein B0H10DRAFT_1950478 [Mycena sp. CBHHK59/15]
MTSPVELRNRKLIRITGTGPGSKSRLFSQAPQLRRVYDCLGRSRNERRARMAKKSNRRSTRSPGVNQRWTGDEPEDRMKKKTSEGTEFTLESSRRRDENLGLSP